MDSLLNACPYVQIYNYLKQNKFETIRFDSRIMGLASADNMYNLSYADEKSINVSNTQHEFFHMWQYRNLDHVSGETRGLREFEQHLFRDILYFNQIKDIYFYDPSVAHYYLWACGKPSPTGPDPDYINWLAAITGGGTGFATIDIADFNNWAVVFGNTYIGYSPDRGYRYTDVDYTLTINDLLHLIDINCP